MGFEFGIPSVNLQSSMSSNHRRTIFFNILLYTCSLHIWKKNSLPHTPGWPNSMPNICGKNSSRGAKTWHVRWKNSTNILCGGGTPQGWNTALWTRWDIFFSTCRPLLLDLKPFRPQVLTTAKGWVFLWPHHQKCSTAIPKEVYIFLRYLQRLVNIYLESATLKNTT